MRRLRCHLIAIAAAVWAATPSFAQQDHARVAVPLYRPVDAMQGLVRSVVLPRAEGFAVAAGRLPAAVQARCDSRQGAGVSSLDGARAAWRDTLIAWELLSAVPVGPLIERRSARQIDFSPTRPELITRATARGPKGAEAMARVGTPAKGLPALEWLLWTRPVAPATPACDFAAEVAAELARESEALRLAVAEHATAEWDEARGNAAFAEFINQWVGAAERLRWAQIGRPRMEAASPGRRSGFARASSGETAASWARQWATLREFAVFDGAEAPAPGSGLVPIETYLRGRGLNSLADRWRGQVEQASRALQRLTVRDARRLDGAVRELAALKGLAESEVAPALEVSIGFSDSDGD